MDLPALPGYAFEVTPAGIISLLVTFFLPIVAGFFMKQSWHTSVKGIILMLIVAIKVVAESVIQDLNNNVQIDIYGIVYAVAINWVISVAAYFGWLKGSGPQVAAITSGVKDTPPRP